MDDGTQNDRPDALSRLAVFDQLEIGPPKVEEHRIITSYRLFAAGKEECRRLIYRYPENVFSPGEAESMNLAAMVTSQVAINYGLFCEKIIFHGVFDHADRRFIQEMAENTAREIYVKKILGHNPYLTDDMKQFPVINKNKYLQAALIFPDILTDQERPVWQLWKTSRNRHLVLSSGGKESLLSFGLINEIGETMGLETHAVFANESGRHWFTALNAYSHFKKTFSHTGKFWTNSDRIFSWMAGQMPFIRENFANIQADIYPIRLWTVAVFVFGALPLMRKYGIGRLLIGDEYDTTTIRFHQGIKHYDGLFDQSLHFDNALSGFFLRKGWAISQFSILRPLSELLVEKILVERYPHLQTHQTSCHSAHKGSDKILPCGKCEKCRRVVSMLVALGADPKQCGYTDPQIKSCLSDLVKFGSHQEPSGLDEVFKNLSEKKLITLPTSKSAALAAHPEVFKIRFDGKRSPMNAIPENLRRPVLNIFMEHANGCVKRGRSQWEGVNALADPDMRLPYPYELKTKPGDKTDIQYSFSKTNGYQWGELSWPEFKKRVEKVDIALLPVGAIEQHGPHLPLDTDAFDAQYLANRVAFACSAPKPFVLPLVAYGISYHHDDFPGTLTISNEALSRMIYDIGMSVVKNGIRKLVIINGHGGNMPALNYAAQTINQDAGIFVCVDTGETSDVDINALIETPNDVHAGEMETSTTMAIRPHLVRTEHLKKSVPEFSSRYLNFSSKRSTPWYGYTHKISSSGVMGNPEKADPVKGAKIWEIMIAHLVALVEDLKSMTLDEIYNKKL